MSGLDGVLWIFTKTVGDEAAASPILGIPLVRRTVLAARRAGFSRILVEGGPGGSLGKILQGTGAEVVARDGRPPELGPSRLVLLAAAVLPQVKWLCSLLQAPLEPGQLAVDGQNCAAFTDAKAPTDLLLALQPGENENPIRTLARRLPVVSRPADPAGRFPLERPADRPRIERWLLRSLIKDTEGFMSRHFERRISLAISRRLAATRVTPNGMTLVSVAVGLAGAGFFLSSRPAAEFTGALLFLIHSILDGCDGELARLKFQESRFGGVLDFWGDNVVHCAVFGAVAIAWARTVGESWPLVAGAAAIGGTLASAGFVYRTTMARPHEGPLFASVTDAPDSWLARAADALARRDFIYVIVILSAFGKAHWFLALAAVGAPLFFLVLVALAAGRGATRSFS